MGAISMYRGNLHRVPDVPRRHLMPPQRMSPGDFRNLVDRRNRCLPDVEPMYSGAADAAGVVKSDANVVEQKVEEDVQMVDVRVEDGGDSRPLDEVMEVDVKEKEIVAPSVVEVPVTVKQEKKVVNKEKEERIRQVEERLQYLNEKKHGYVKKLKQILNAEEEARRLVNAHANRPPLPLQVDASNDSGSMTQHATPRKGSDANVAADMDIGGDDTLNHNPQSRQLLRMSSTSPSAESALRRAPHFQHNSASYPSRAVIVAAGSPSRFAPTGHQGQSSSLTTVSVTGTNYAPSSPSPAASGGTSVFRDARHPSPWK